MRDFLDFFKKIEKLPERAEELPKKGIKEELFQGVAIEDISLPEQEQARLPVDPLEEIVLNELEENEIEKKDRLFGGVNAVFLVKLKDDGSGIFKPKNGEERELRECAAAGTYFKRERAAYLIDRFLGFGIVPPTILREIDGEIGSFQQFIPEAKVAYQVPDKELKNRALAGELATLWLLDFIIYNSDRHKFNFLVKSNNKVYAIDNGLSFAKDNPKFYEEFFNRLIPIPSEVAAGIERFLSWPEGKELCEQVLKQLLSADEVNACMARIERIGSIIKRYGEIPENERQQLTF